MSFSMNQLNTMSIAIHSMTSENWDKILIKLNRSNQLKELLQLIERTDLLPINDEFVSTGCGTIVIVGETRLKKYKIEEIFSKHRIGKHRLEIIPTYEEAKKYSFEKTRYQPLRYAAIFVGPMPHNTIGVDGWSSIIKKMETEDGYPPIIRCSTELHISNSSLNIAIQKAIKERIIIPDN